MQSLRKWIILGMLEERLDFEILKMIDEREPYILYRFYERFYLLGW